MTKDSVFFTIHAIQPSSSRRFYFHSNKLDSNSLLNYIIDAHSFDDMGNKPYNFVNNHDQKIYDQKLGFTDFNNLPKPHKNTMVFTGLISFDDELSKQDIFKIHWQDISTLIYQTLIQNMSFDSNSWEMQSGFHVNTNNKHIQFRIYQNYKTEDKDIFQKYFIKKDVVNLIKTKIWKLINSKGNNEIINYPHVLKGNMIHEDNKKVKENKSLILDFVNIINMKSFKDQDDIKKLKKITDLYYQRQWFEDWITLNLKKWNLNEQELEELRTVIKNNISYEIYNFVQNNKKLKVYDFISKKDPNLVKKQKFKNFNKINKQIDFQKVAGYHAGLINLVYKEPISNFIDLVFSKQQYNISELETSINNYLVSLRPNIKQKLIFKKNSQNSLLSDSIFNSLSSSLLSFFKTPKSEYNKNIPSFKTLVNFYYNNQWFEQWMKEHLLELNLSQSQLCEVRKIIKNNITDEIYNLIQFNKDQPLNSFDNQLKNNITLEKAISSAPPILDQYKQGFVNLTNQVLNMPLYESLTLKNDINNYLKSINKIKDKEVSFTVPLNWNEKKIRIN